MTVLALGSIVRLTGTVIRIVEIDVARIFLTDINVWHRKLSLFLLDVDGYRLQLDPLNDLAWHVPETQYRSRRQTSFPHAGPVRDLSWQGTGVCGNSF
jgi:hypothetical protein